MFSSFGCCPISARLTFLQIQHRSREISTFHLLWVDITYFQKPTIYINETRRCFSKDCVFACFLWFSIETNSHVDYFSFSWKYWYHFIEICYYKCMYNFGNHFEWIVFLVHSSGPLSGLALIFSSLFLLLSSFKYFVLGLNLKIFWPQPSREKQIWCWNVHLVR